MDPGSASRPPGDLRRILTVSVEAALTAAALVPLHLLGLTGPLPLVVLLAVIAGCGIVNGLSRWRWGPRSTPRQIATRVALGMGTTTAMIYALGWGPALGVGYGVIVADEIQNAGAVVWRPAAWFTVLGIAAGQLAIATGLVSSYIPQPQVHGLAVLTALGMVFLIRQFGQKTAAVEVAAASRSLAEASLRRSEQRFRSLIQNAPDVVTVTDAHGTVLWVSASVESVMGYRPESFVSSRIRDIVHPDDLKILVASAAFVIGHPGEDSTVEMRVRHADGAWHWHEVTSRNELDDPAVGGIVTNHRDISEARAYRDQLAHEARHDSLTGLVNRKGFGEHLEDALARARRQGRGVAVLFVDLDRFKLINDTLGHSFGDQVLMIAAARLGACLRPEDTLARFAGDEFTVLLENVVDATVGGRAADRFTRAFTAPMHVGARSVVVTASVGVTISPLGQESAEDLLRQADLAMYAAKQGGRDRSAVFDLHSTPQFADRVDLEAGLRAALGNRELVLHFQPIVTLPAAEVTGFEALLRWQRPGVGLVAPGAFIGVAEDTGLIVGIGQWVLETACRTVVEWRGRRPGQPLAINVNVSPVQLREPRFAESVARVLSTTGLPPAALTLEITESMLLTGEETATVLDELHALGLRLALDDFGTGYSSLSYLRRLPVDIVKIDRAFVADLDSESADTAVVRAVVDIAGRLGMTTIAEGVETEQQARALTELGCGLAQGFLFGRPEPADLADAHLELPRIRPYLAGSPTGGAG